MELIYGLEFERVTLAVHYAVISTTYRERAKEEPAILVTEATLEALAEYCRDHNALVSVVPCSAEDLISDGRAISHILVITDCDEPCR